MQGKRTLALAPLLLIAGVGYAQEGSITAWGWNENGQCDVPAPNQEFVFIVAGGST